MSVQRQLIGTATSSGRKAIASTTNRGMNAYTLQMREKERNIAKENKRVRERE